MIDTAGLAVAEQDAAAVDVPDGAPLYTQAEQEQYRRSALRLRQAAVSLEAVAVATDKRLARAHLAGAYRFIKDGRKVLAEGVGAEAAK